MDNGEGTFIGILFVAVTVMGYFLWQQGQQIVALNNAQNHANENIEIGNQNIDRANSHMDSMRNDIQDVAANYGVDYSDTDQLDSDLDMISQDLAPIDTVNSSTQN
jgi:predicted PurR-regulated permease PerM